MQLYMYTCMQTRQSCVHIMAHNIMMSNVQIRRPIGTVFELLLPALAVVALVGIR